MPTWSTRWSVALLVAVTTACGEEGGFTMEPPPEGPPTLSEDVQPILDLNCAFSGCHGGSIVEPQEKPMDLSEGQVRGSTVNVAALQAPDLDRIEPFDPDDSYLIHKIQGTQAQVGGSGERMPPALPPLSASEVDVIREWIQEGAQDN